MRFKSILRILFFAIAVIPIQGGSSASAEILEALGPQKFAVILVDYANDGSAPTTSYVEVGLFNSPNSTSSFIDVASYGKTQIVWDFFDWIVPINPLYGTGWTACWPLDQDRFNMILDNYPDVILSDYDGFIFYVNRLDDTGCSAGVANGYGKLLKETYTSFGTIDTRVAYFSTDFYTPYEYSRTTNSTVIHELIHTLGISNHSNSYTCGDQKLSSNSADCFVQAYGDIYSIMGLRYQSTYPNIVTSERLGWLDENHITTVTQSGQFTIYAIEDQSDNVKGIKIPLSVPISISDTLEMDSLYLEYRAMTGFNERNTFFRNIEQIDGTYVLIDDTDGALVRGADCGTNGYCIPYLLDMHPNTIDAKYPPYSVANAYLFPSESFKIPLNDITIEIVSVEPGISLTVNVDFNTKKPIDSSGGGCFIATAAYGSYWEPHVITLRQFRDNYLLTNKLGNQLVNTYYKYSPQIANYIAEHDSLRSVARGGLAPLVGFSWLALNYGMLAALILLFSMMTLVTGMTCLVARTKKD